MGYWHNGPTLRDEDDVRHTSFSSVSSSDGEYYIPCNNVWTQIRSRWSGYAPVTDFVTCITCAMFVVHNGSISLWVPR